MMGYSLYIFGASKYLGHFYFENIESLKIFMKNQKMKYLYIGTSEDGDNCAFGNTRKLTNKEQKSITKVYNIKNLQEIKL